MIYSAPIGASADTPRRDVAGRTPNAGVDFECSRLAASAIAASASIVARSKAISRAWAWRFAELLCGDATSAECWSQAGGAADPGTRPSHQSLLAPFSADDAGGEACIAEQNA